VLRDLWDVIVLGAEKAVASTRLEYADDSGRTKILAEGAGLVKLTVLTHLHQN
jgi:threonine dehydratase